MPLGIVDPSIKNSQNFYNGIARIDWNMGGRSDLSARYIHNDTGTDVVGSSIPAFALPGHSLALLGAINYSRVFGASTAINLNGGYNRLSRSTGAGNFFFPGQPLSRTLGSSRSESRSVLTSGSAGPQPIPTISLVRRTGYVMAITLPSARNSGI